MPHRGPLSTVLSGPDPRNNRQAIMDTLDLFLLGISLIIAMVVFWLGLAADWPWGGAVVAALVPIAFTLFFGIVGIVISVIYLGAIFKATV